MNEGTSLSLKSNHETQRPPLSTHSSNSNGFSIIEVLVAVGILMIGVMALISFQSSQQRETKALTEKLGSLDLARTVTSSIGTPSGCGALFAVANVTTPGDLSFTTTAASPTTPHVIKLNQIPGPGTSPPIATSGSAASTLSSSLRILPTASTPAGIEVQVTSPTSASLVVNFDTNGLVRPLKSLSFPILLRSNTAAGVTTITGCQGGFSSCQERYPATVEKISCGILAQVMCLPGETLVFGGSTFGQNISVQNSQAITDASGVPVGWTASWYDSSTTGPAGACGINSFPDGATAPGGPPYTAPCFAGRCGSAKALCCQ